MNNSDLNFSTMINDKSQAKPIATLDEPKGHPNLPAKLEK
jgi:hypothetical protein